jgi:hypothetical protein
VEIELLEIECRRPRDGGVGRALCRGGSGHSARGFRAGEDEEWQQRGTRSKG